VIAAKDLIGRWVSPSPEPMPMPDGNTLYNLRDFILTEKAWAMLFTAYGDPGATFKLFTLRIEGTYNLGAASTDVPGARNADFHFAGRYLTANAQPMLDMFKGAKAGDGNWQLGVEQDVSKTGCLFIPSVAQAPVEYDLVRRDGDNLFFGDRSADLTKARPKKLIGAPVARR
jgi:hypothetical protein